MKKLVLFVAVALMAISCGNKAEQENQEAEAPAVEVVEEAPAQEAAPAVKEEAKEEAAPEKEKSLIQRAVELGEDVAAEVEKNK